MNEKTHQPGESSLTTEDMRLLAVSKVEFSLKDEIRYQSDRASAIIASSVLEESLKAYLMSHLLMENGNAKKRRPDTKSLFNPEGGVGSFSAKTKLAYAMRLISRDMFFDLDDIREIRNRFAHWPLTKEEPHRRKLLTFQVDAIRVRAMRLVYPSVYFPSPLSRLWGLLTSGTISSVEFCERVKTEPLEPELTDPRDRFLDTCNGLTSMFSKAISPPVTEISLDYRNPPPQTQRTE